MSRLDILKASLEKKQAKFNRKLNEHFSDVKSANGQPLNDKRNGYSTMKRWDRQNDTLSRMQKEIEKTQTAIEREEGRIRCIDRNRSSMPEEIQKLISDGTLKQWGRYPHIMFVDVCYSVDGQVFRVYEIPGRSHYTGNGIYKYYNAGNSKI